MKEDPELHIDDGSPHDESYSTGRGIRTDGNKRFPALLGIILILIFAVGILYFITNRPTARDTKGEETLASKIAALEQKVTSLEGQITELQGKSNKGRQTRFFSLEWKRLQKRWRHSKSVHSSLVLNPKPNLLRQNQRFSPQEIPYGSERRDPAQDWQEIRGRSGGTP